MHELNEAFVAEAIGSLISVRRTNLGVEVQTPVIYPNGDLVAVTVTLSEGQYVVHDGGNGAAVLSAAGASVTSKVAKKLHRLAEHYGCEFVNGRMLRACLAEDVGVCAAIVANASRSIGDQLLTQDKQPIIDFRREVLERVRDTIGSPRFRENEEVIGKSGSSYRISAVVLDREQKEPIGFVEPVKDHEAATKKFREFWDISQSSDYIDVRRVSLYNEKRGWAQGDLALLQQVSNLVRLTDTEARMKEFVAS